MQPEPRVLVYGVTSAAARAWCSRNGIPPHGRSTHILTQNAGRGMLVRPEDRVVFVGDVEERRDYETVRAALLPALINVGAEAKIERVAESGQS